MSKGAHMKKLVGRLVRAYQELGRPKHAAVNPQASSSYSLGVDQIEHRGAAGWPSPKTLPLFLRFPPGHAEHPFTGAGLGESFTSSAGARGSPLLYCIQRMLSSCRGGGGRCRG